MVKLTDELRQKIIWEYRHGFEANRSKNSLFQSQKDIYSTVGSHLVEDIMAGYNGTIFAYGQSGSGKTYTMYGEDTFDENKKIALNNNQDLKKD